MAFSVKMIYNKEVVKRATNKKRERKKMKTYEQLINAKKTLQQEQELLYNLYHEAVLVGNKKILPTIDASEEELSEQIKEINRELKKLKGAN